MENIEDILRKEGVLLDTIEILKKEGFEAKEDLLMLSNENLKNLGLGLQQILKVMKVVKSLRGNEHVGDSSEYVFRSPIMSPTRIVTDIASLKAQRYRKLAGSSSRISERSTTFSTSSTSSLAGSTAEFKERVVNIKSNSGDKTNINAPKPLQSLVPPSIYIVKPIAQKPSNVSQFIDKENISRPIQNSEEEDLRKMLHLHNLSQGGEESETELTTPRNEDAQKEKYYSLNINYPKGRLDGNTADANQESKDKSKLNLPMNKMRRDSDDTIFSWTDALGEQNKENKKRRSHHHRSVGSIKSFASVRSNYSALTDPDFVSAFVKHEIGLATHNGIPCVIIDLDRVDCIHTEAGCMYITPKLRQEFHTPLTRCGIPTPITGIRTGPSITRQRSHKKSTASSRRSSKGKRNRDASEQSTLEKMEKENIQVEDRFK